ncbi:MAG TPA: penicillin-binding transpeptidase domain-containing protein, partial [Actinopolymorphaceae bacterium]
KKGAVVALEPSTGAVLAMVSLPAFDPNDLASHDVGDQEKAWKAYLDDDGKPMNQRATQFHYPPGSTFKLVTTAAALESGRYEPDTEVPAPAKFDLPLSERTLNNWQRGLCGSSDEITLTEALETSCNTAYADLGLKLGTEALDEQAKKFGFGTKFLPKLGGAASRFPSDANEPQTALASIGQFDVQATPLQMAMVAAAIANGGEVMEPYIIEKLNAPDTSPLEVTEPEVVGRAVSSEVAEELNQMMVSVVDNGTGDDARIPGVKVAGKTGTAQTTEDAPPYAWFVSFAPADNPQVAVAVVIEEADVGRDEISGGKLAAPIAKAVMEAVIQP